VIISDPTSFMIKTFPLFARSAGIFLPPNTLVERGHNLLCKGIRWIPTSSPLT
jgi:hypothetical protein